MQSHAHHIQAILARELDLHARQVQLAQAGMPAMPVRAPHGSGIAGGAGAQTGMTARSA
jgi:phytoene/squalene synthetase